MFQLSHLTAREAVALQHTLMTLGIARERQCWRVPPFPHNTDDWHCTITDPTPEESAALAALMKGGYGNAEGDHWGACRHRRGRETRLRRRGSRGETVT